MPPASSDESDAPVEVPPELPHLYLPLTDPTGAIYSGALVRLILGGTEDVPLQTPVYLDPALTRAFVQNQLVSPTVLELWSPIPLRLTVQFTPIGGIPIRWENVDVHAGPIAMVRAPATLAIDSANFAPGLRLVAQSATTAIWG